MERKLQPRVMVVLQCLASDPGEPWSRQQLLDTAWSDVVVGDEALTMAISKLRRALGDSSRSPRFVETIPKQGYRLVCPVDADREPDDDPKPSMPEPGRWDPRWVLVGLVAVLLVLAAVLSLPRAPSTARSEPVVDIRLTSQPGPESQAEVSPDEQHVAYVQQGPPRTGPGVYTMALDGRSLRRLAEGKASSPVWSPDGGRIAYTAYRQDRTELRIVTLLGGDPKVLTSAGPCPLAGIDWSPDGRWIVASLPTADGQTCAAFAVDVDTAERIQLTFPPAGSFDSRPTYSPDGTRLAFSRGETSFVHDLHVVPVRGGAPRRLTTDGQRIWGFDWMDDGDALVMASNRQGRFQLWRVPLDGGPPTWIPVPAENVRFPSITGETLVFDSYELGAGIWRVDPGSEPRSEPVLGSKSRDSNPRHDPEGRRVAFVSDRSGAREVWLVADGDGPRRLSSLGATQITGPQWSPDGRFLVFGALVGDTQSIHILDVEDGTTWELEGPGESGQLGHPSFSADGASIYVALGRFSDWTLWRVPVHGGSPVAVVDHGVFGRESSDGATLFYTDGQDRQIWRMPITGRDATPVTEDLAPAGASAWSLVADEIVYLRASDDGSQLVRHRIEGEAPEILASLPQGLLASSISISPLDGSILFSRYRTIESDVRLVTGFR
ncbi:MAG: winged helix-turn-helix domain-containing protein [Acidobacteriota bacterium]